MRTFNQVIQGTVLGKTAGTYDDIGTITIRKGANYIVGYYVSIVNAKATADEASTARIRINSSDLGWSNLDQPGNCVGSEGMAAHQASLVPKVFYPLTSDITGEDLHFAEITFSVTGVVNCTEGFECGIQLVTSDEPPTEALLNALRGDWCGAYTGGNGAIEAAGAGDSAALASWGTTDADMLVIDAGANNLVGLAYTLGPNAETAGVGIVNMLELTCPDIPGFGKQEILANYAISGALGTVINSIQEKPVRLLPFCFDGLPKNKVKIALSDISSITGFTAADGQANIVWN